MLLRLLADILAMDSLIRIWQSPLPFLWWQLLVMMVGDLMLTALRGVSIRRSGRRSSASRNLGLLALFNRLGLIGLSLASMLP